MSIYNASHPSAGDSDPTSKTKTRITNWITELFYTKGYKTWIKEETGAVIDYKPYHLDLGILCRNKETFDEYHFFGVELDWDVGHATARTDIKDDNKDRAFLSIGIPVLRFRMEELYGHKALSEAERNKKIWDFFETYCSDIEMVGEVNDKFLMKNRDLAIRLKENASTKCRECNHLAHLHDLSGCSFKNTNKAKLRCYCNEPYFVSDA